MTYTPSLVDIVSVMAAGLVVLSFGLPRWPWLCGVTMIVNVLFVSYGLYLDLFPVWLLHLVVLGLQLLRYDLGGGPHAHYAPKQSNS